MARRENPFELPIYKPQRLTGRGIDEFDRAYTEWGRKYGVNKRCYHSDSGEQVSQFVKDDIERVIRGEQRSGEYLGDDISIELIIN